MEAFGDYDFDEHPFAALGGYDQAQRVFDGEASLGRLIAGLNAALFGGRWEAGKAETGRVAKR